MRIAIGAILGLVLGTAVVAATGLAFNNYAYLGGLAAGVLAGVLMRLLTGPGGPVYAKGALAAMATAAATVLGPFAQAQWFRSQLAGTQAAPRITISEEADTDDASGDASADGEAVVAVAETRAYEGSTLKAPLRAPARDPFSTAEVACLVIGCLAAYQIGKGSMPPPPEEESDEDADAPHNEPSPLPPVD